MDNSRVLVEPVESIELDEVGQAKQGQLYIPGDMQRIAHTEEQGEAYPVGIVSTRDVPTHVAQGCLRIALQPTSDMLNNDSSIEQQTEMATCCSAAPYSSDAGRQYDKDEALSIVIQKLTEIVHGNNKKQQEQLQSSCSADNDVSVEGPVCEGTKNEDQSSGVGQMLQVSGDEINADKLYKCPTCPCLFALNVDLEAGQKVPVCECCASRSKRDGNTSQDEVYFVPEPELKDFKCNMCDFKTLGKALFYAHLRTHTDDEVFKCKLCDYATTMKNLMTRHQRTHEISRKYKCNQCDFVTVELSVLQDHLKIHNQNQELMLKCSECGYSCKCEELLREHMWKHIDKIAPHGIVQVQMEGAQNEEPAKPADGDQVSSDPSPLSNSPVSSQTVASKPQPTAPSLFKCLLCGYVCEKLCTLKAHAWRHAGEEGCSYPNIEDLFSAITESGQPQKSTASSTSQITTCCGPKGGKTCCEMGSNISKCQCEPVRVSSKHFPTIENLISTAYARKYIQPQIPQIIRTAVTEINESDQSMAKQRMESSSGSASPVNSKCVEKLSVSNTDSSDKLNSKELSARSSIALQEDVNTNDVSSIHPKATASLQQLISNTVESQINKGATGSNSTHSVDKSELLQTCETAQGIDDQQKQPSEVSIKKEDIGCVIVEHTTTDEKMNSNKHSSGSSSGNTGVSCSNLLASLLQKSRQKVLGESPESIPKTSTKHPSANKDSLESLIAATLAGLRSQKAVSTPLEKTPPLEDDHKLKSTASVFIPPVARIHEEPSTNMESTNMEISCSNYKPDSLDSTECIENVVEIEDQTEVVVSDDPSEKGKKRPGTVNDAGMVTRSKKRKAGAVSPSTFSEDSNDSTCSRSAGISSSLLTVIERFHDNPNVSREEILEKLMDTSKPAGGGVRDVDMRSVDLDGMIETVDDLTRPFRCKLCHYSSTNKGYVKQHLRMHKERVPYKCPLCDVIGESSNDLQEHMMDHCKQRTYQCTECSATFSYKSQLRAHVRGHNERVPFMCDTCDYETCTSSSFRTHLRTHTENKVYTCSACNTTFNQRYLLRQHKQLCEMNKLYSCQECDFTADSKEGLAKHLEEHVKPYKCEICDYSSATMNGVKNHMKFHATEKPYRCQYCNFAGPYPQSLRSHMKKHYGEMQNSQQLEQYKCNLCGYICSHLPSLKSHMWRHASEPNYNYDVTNSVINAALDYDTKQMTGPQQEKNVTKPAALPEKKNLEESSIEVDSESLLHVKQNKNKGFEYCLVAFRCCQCGFESIDKAILTEHMKTHSGESQMTTPATQNVYQYRPKQKQHKHQGGEGTSVMNTLETLADGIERCLEPDAIQVAHQEEVATEI